MRFALSPDEIIANDKVGAGIFHRACGDLLPGQ
jgi:hypothetical protein